MHVNVAVHKHMYVLQLHWRSDVSRVSSVRIRLLQKVCNVELLHRVGQDDELNAMHLILKGKT